MTRQRLLHVRAGSREARLDGSTGNMGSGQNISVQGVFFTTADCLPVTVRINGKSETLPAELVRYETLGDGQVGIAVRFLKPNPSLTS